MCPKDLIEDKPTLFQLTCHSLSYKSAGRNSPIGRLSPDREKTPDQVNIVATYWVIVSRLGQG